MCRQCDIVPETLSSALHQLFEGTEQAQRIRQKPERQTKHKVPKLCSISYSSQTPFIYSPFNNRIRTLPHYKHLSLRLKIKINSLLFDSFTPGCPKKLEQNHLP
jgi:hypothetical protein